MAVFEMFMSTMMLVQDLDLASFRTSRMLELSPWRMNTCLVTSFVTSCNIFCIFSNPKFQIKFAAYIYGKLRTLRIINSINMAYICSLLKNRIFVRHNFFLQTVKGLLINSVWTISLKK